MSEQLCRDSHIAIPACADLARLGIGILGIGTSGQFGGWVKNLHLELLL